MAYVEKLSDYQFFTYFFTIKHAFRSHRCYYSKYWIASGKQWVSSNSFPSSLEV